MCAAVWRIRLAALLIATGLGDAAVAQASTNPAGLSTAEAAGIAVRIDGRQLAHVLTSAFIAPDKPIRIAAPGLPVGDAVSLTSADKALNIKQRTSHRWRIADPTRPGIYRLVIRDRTAGTRRSINLFVMQRFDPHDDAIDGYRIGHYERKPLRGRPIYDAPDALMPIDKDQQDVHLSPHFTVGQFLCGGQTGRWPKYVIVRPALVAKLEAILTALNQRGIPARTLVVMSGYRTPAYNKAIGNTTSYSRHLYGGAADIYVDTNHDGQMDDLNGDGRVDKADADWLARLIANLDKKYPAFVGGLAAYSANAAHGPFVHTDVRGFAVRW